MVKNQMYSHDLVLADVGPVQNPDGFSIFWFLIGRQRACRAKWRPSCGRFLPGHHGDANESMASFANLGGQKEFAESSLMLNSLPLLNCNTVSYTVWLAPAQGSCVKTLAVVDMSRLPKAFGGKPACKIFDDMCE